MQNEQVKGICLFTLIFVGEYKQQNHVRAFLFQNIDFYMITPYFFNSISKIFCNFDCNWIWQNTDKFFVLFRVQKLWNKLESNILFVLQL